MTKEFSNTVPSKNEMISKPKKNKLDKISEPHENKYHSISSSKNRKALSLKKKKVEKQGIQLKIIKADMNTVTKRADYLCKVTVCNQTLSTKVDPSLYINNKT